MVTYRRDGGSVDDIYGQAVKGTHATSGSQREGDPVHIHTIQRWWHQRLDITGSINHGRYMVVRNECRGGDLDCNVLGQMVAPYAVYLPVVLENHSR